METATHSIWSELEETTNIGWKMSCRVSTDKTKVDLQPVKTPFDMRTKSLQET
jgi:hypothetical protein